jgi:CheY-like chemotaxis protein
MPKMNGSTVVEFNRGNNNCPIVICSSGQRDEYKDLHDFEEDHEFNQYIQKPFEIDLLLEIVRKVVNAS